MSVAADLAPSEGAIARPLVFLLAASCGLAVANLYYAQPLIAPISAALGLSTAAAGLIVTMTQIGYVIGLLFIVPLGDLLENKRLITVVLGLCALALLGATFATRALPFLLSMLAIGLCSVVVQILIPLTAHLAPEATRGRVVGTVTSGLMLGIMLSRPVASFITHLSSWRTVFGLSTVVTFGLALALARLLPTRRPPPGLHYHALLRSMLHLALTTKVLWRRSAYQFCSFGAFSLFWTTVPLLLQEPRFGFTQAGIAWFGLAAVAGAVAAPFAGTLADRGLERFSTGLGLASVATAFLLTHVEVASPVIGVGLLVLAAILLDFGTSATLVVSQRAVFSLGPTVRARLNGLFLAMFFIGGALGSALGAWVYAKGGWGWAAWAGVMPPIVALGLFATEFRRS
ncbi:MFS transporter [Lichenihabitans sp. Uapishka_5]|uniref:MFS transporter n=1 Tax=Lichenihabitans sp. Uapishka_5 TaxID=3037302 RepID=UPI0029E7ECD2|nr:MFS transporter [Lichenihabitans sp. Uapishka_5]MDX7950048.1 MFS transporter [Lichenihabitans sp. Uapishka_5]